MQDIENDEDFTHDDKSFLVNERAIREYECLQARVTASVEQESPACKLLKSDLLSFYAIIRQKVSKLERRKEQKRKEAKGEQKRKEEKEERERDPVIELQSLSLQFVSQ